MRSAIAVERTDLEAAMADPWGVSDARHTEGRSKALAGRRRGGRGASFLPTNIPPNPRGRHAISWGAVASVWTRDAPASGTSALRAGVADKGEIAFSTPRAGSGELCDTLF